MKKIYLVRGSEDGNLGVYSTMKLAYEEAVKYIKGGEDHTPSISYSRVTKLFKEYRTVTIERIETNFGSVDIECFYLNQTW